METIITWAYIAGLLEADGSINIFLRKDGTFDAIVSISQKNNTNILNMIKDYWLKHGINSTIDPGVDGRASNLRVQGNIQVAKLLNLFEEKFSKLPFCSQKFRDFLIVKEVLTNKFLSLAQIIDLVKSLHKQNMHEPDNEVGNISKRVECEQRLGLTPNASIKAAESILSKIDVEYKKHQKEIEEKMSALPEGCFSASFLDIDPDFFIGLIDGDGSFYITNSFTHRGDVSIIKL